MSFKPLRIVLRMDGPVVDTGEPLHLDAILSYLRVRHEPGASHGPHGVAWEPAEAEEVSLPLATIRHGDLWWYRASAVRLVGARSRGFWVKRFDAENLDALNMGKATQIVTTLGPYKAMKVPQEIVHAPELVFWAVGERDRVYRALKRLRGVGKKTAQGFGIVGAVEVNALNLDPVVFDRDWRTEDCKPARNLPLAWARDRGLSFDGQVRAPIRPPYWRRGVVTEVAR